MMTLVDMHNVLAATTGEAGANDFLKSSIGKAVVAICGAIGIVIVVVCILRMVRSVTSGRPGEGFKILFFGLLIGGMLFDLGLTITGVKNMATLIGKFFDSANDITG